MSPRKSSTRTPKSSKKETPKIQKITSSPPNDEAEKTATEGVKEAEKSRLEYILVDGEEVGVVTEGEEGEEGKKIEEEEKGEEEEARRATAHLPNQIFGVNINKTGSATLGLQVAMHEELMNVKEELKEANDRIDHMAGEIHAMKETLELTMRVCRESINQMTDAVFDRSKQYETKLKAEVDQQLQKQQNEQEKVLAKAREDLQEQLEESIKKLEHARKAGKVEEEEKGKVDPSIADHQPIAQWAKMKRKSDTVDMGETNPPKIQKNQSPAELFQLAMKTQRQQKKKVQFSCVFCLVNAHKSEVCAVYPSISERKARLAELNVCATCGKQHSATCRFEERPCPLCKDRHQAYLCFNTFQ